jgi:hypothetical protein
MAVNQVKRNGSYAPLSAYYYDDNSVICAGEKAEVLFCRLLAFSARQLKDGFVSDAQMSRVGTGLSGLRARIDSLVEFGLIERVDESLFGNEGRGYRVVQWLKWNLSADEIQQKQKRDSARKPKVNP